MNDRRAHKALLRVLVLLGILIGSALAADDSPTAYFAAQDAENAKNNAAILAATTPEELMELDLLPKRYAAMFAERTAEERAEIVDGVKQGLDIGWTAAEKIDGDRAFVLRESSYPGAWQKVVEMNRVDGAWIPGEEIFMQYSSGASGSFTVTGAATAQLAAGLVAGSDGYAGEQPGSFLIISDILGQYLLGWFGAVPEVPSVAFTHPNCLIVGSHSISYPGGWFKTGGADRSDKRLFDENISGTLKVTKVEGGRFWADFEMTVVMRARIGEKQDPNQTVSIIGTIENALNLCPDGG